MAEALTGSALGVSGSVHEAAGRVAAAGRRWLLTGLLMVTGCGNDSVEPAIPGELRVSPASWTLVSLGDTVRLSATVLDNAGQPMPEATVEWSTTDSSVALVDATGLVTAVGNGPALVSAMVGSASGSARITVRQAASALEVVGGDDQRAHTGRPLPEAVTVAIEDARGSPVADVSVTFAPVDDRGSVDPGSTVTDSTGRASTIWTLGEEPGVHRLMVLAGDLSADVSAVAFLPIPVVTFTERTASVREGDSVALHVTVSPTPSAPLEVGYEVGVDGIRATADADEADYEGPREGRIRFDSLTASATINLTVRDDEDIEPPREVLVVRLLASEGVYELATSTARVVIAEGVCDRTGQVALTIIASTNRADCSEVTGKDLLGIDRMVIPSEPDRLANLRANDFDGLVYLDSLSIRDHDLTQLPDHVFSDLRNLTSLLVQYGLLTSLSPNVFAGLESLTNLELRGNQLGLLEDGTFSALSTLRRLELADNALTTLSAGALGNLSNLRILALGNNQLTELPNDVFVHLTGLGFLSLNHNRLSRLPDGIFSPLTQLRRLSLWSNELGVLSSDVFAGLHSLESLNLRNNRLKELPSGVFAGLHSLERLELYGNPGTPFAFRLQLHRVDNPDLLAPGPASVAVTVAEGAPLPVALPLQVSNASVSDTLLAVETGATTGAAVAVERGPGTGPTYLALGSPPPVDVALGFEFRAGDALILFARTDNRAPEPVSEVPAQVLQVGAQQVTLELDSYFSDEDGDSLTYQATADPRVLTVTVAGNEATLVAGDPGETTLIATARDPEGFFASHQVPVTVLPEPDPDVFNIDLVFVGNHTPEVKRALRAAAERWMEVLTGDLSDMPMSGRVGPADTSCLAEEGRHRFAGIVDDLVVFVGHGETGISGFSAPCLVREGSYLPYVGGIEIARSRQKESLHLLGHTLGFHPIIWYSRGLLANPVAEKGPGADSHFTGPLAVEAFDAAGGTTYTAGAKVPVENRFGRDNVLVNSHWRSNYPTHSDRQAAVFQGELMSFTGGSRSLSAVTVQSFADLGYEVDATRADPYTLYGGAAAALTAQDGEEGQHPEFRNDIHPGAIAVADGNGNIIRIIRW